MAIPALIPIGMALYKAYKIYKTAKFLKAGYDSVRKVAPIMAATATMTSANENDVQTTNQPTVDIKDTTIESKVIAETANVTNKKDKSSSKVKSAVINAKNFFNVAAANIEESNNASKLDSLKKGISRTLEEKGLDSSKINDLNNRLNKENTLSGVESFKRGISKTLEEKGLDPSKIKSLANDMTSLVQDMSKGIKRGMK